MEFNPTLLQLFKSLGVQKRYKKGSILFFEGEKAKDIILLIDGCLRIYKTDINGNQINIHFFKPINFIAEMPVFENTNYPASGIFESDSEIISINFEKFKNFYLRDEKVVTILVRSLMEKIRYLEQMINENFSYDVQMRFILFLLQHEKSSQQFSQRNIAKMINTTPETLNRIVKKLKNKGWIKTLKGKIEVLDSRALKQYKIDHSF